MKRKENIIDALASHMRDETVSEEEIIELISKNVNDLDMGDEKKRTLL